METTFYSLEYYHQLLALRVLANYDISAKTREAHDEEIKAVRESDMSSEGKIEAYKLIYGREDYAR